MTTNTPLLYDFEEDKLASDVENCAFNVSFHLADYLPKNGSFMLPKHEGEEFNFWVSSNDIPSPHFYSIQFGIVSVGDDSYRLNIFSKVEKGYKADLFLVEPTQDFRLKVLFTNSEPPVESDSIVYKSWCFMNNDGSVGTKNFTISELANTQVEVVIQSDQELYT